MCTPPTVSPVTQKKQGNHNCFENNVGGGGPILQQASPSCSAGKLATGRNKTPVDRWCHKFIVLGERLRHDIYSPPQWAGTAIPARWRYPGKNIPRTIDAPATATLRTPTTAPPVEVLPTVDAVSLGRQTNPHLRGEIEKRARARERAVWKTQQHSVVVAKTVSTGRGI